MSIPVSDILSRIDDLMLDSDRIRWPVDERLRWITDAGREIVLRRPAARAVTQDITLVDGTYQSTPAGTAQLLDVIRNKTADGKPGKVVRIADRQIMDDADPDWHNEKAGDTIHYMPDDRSPTTFYVYPPAVSGAIVEALLSMPPPAVTSTSDTFEMRDEFMSAIVNWCLYRCHTKDSEFSQGQLATLHYSAFNDEIGSPAAIAQQNSAKVNSL
jgi:hypothetical protein